MRRAILVMAVLLAGALIAIRPAGAVGEWDRPAVVKEPERFHIGPYTHPRGLYVLVPGPLSKVTVQGERQDIVVRSKRGYVLNVQTGDASPDVPLSEMIARLEAESLGPNKPWTRKRSEAEAGLIGGLPARAAIYEGPGSRIKVIILRGRRADFVVMFLAPPHTFDSLLADLDGVLGTFQPAPEEFSASANRQRRAAPPVVNPGPRPHKDENLGYSLEYPQDWVVSHPTSYSVVIGGHPGGREADATVGIQNVHPPTAATPGEALEAVYGGLRRQLDAPELATAYLGESNWTYAKGGVRLDGMQFLAEYTLQGERIRQTTIVLPRPDAPVAHIWSYQAPHALFQVYWPMAEAMLKSWTLLPVKAKEGSR